MNEKISYIKLPNITTSKLQDVIDFLGDNEIEYVEYYIEDLQKRIDKAIDKLKFYNSGEALYYVPIQDIIDILKESGE